jgi:deazaflavin-dependent oxidoreductase (nitroreductase family)
MEDQQNTPSERPLGSGRPPVRYPAYIGLLGKIDAFFVRKFSFSPVAWRMMRANGLKNDLSPLVLTTKGRKSGRQIDAVLPYYRDGDNYAVIGSMGGQPKHPNWVLNLMADPLCQIHVNGRSRKVRAHIAPADERSRIWDRAIKEYPYYLDYAVSAYPREIPVVVLEAR